MRGACRRLRNGQNIGVGGFSVAAAFRLAAEEIEFLFRRGSGKGMQPDGKRGKSQPEFPPGVVGFNLVKSVPVGATLAAGNEQKTGRPVQFEITEQTCKRRSNNPSLKRPDNLVAPE